MGLHGKIFAHSGGLCVCCRQPTTTPTTPSKSRMLDVVLAAPGSRDSGFFGVFFFLAAPGFGGSGIPDFFLRICAAPESGGPGIPDFLHFLGGQLPGQR